MTIVRYHHLLFLAAWAIGLSKWKTNAFVARSPNSRLALLNLKRPGSYAKPIPSQQQNYNSLSNIDTSIFASSPSKYNNEVLRPSKRADRYIATQLAAALVMLMSLTSCLSLAWAASGDPMVFNGDYNDPLHPMCKRKIEVSKDGKTFHFSGTSVGKQDDKTRRGCSVNEIRMYGFYSREFDGTIVDGNKISIDDGTYEGVWEPAGKITDKSLKGANLDGIRWSNGYKWTKKAPEGTLFDKLTSIQENAADKRKEIISQENVAEKTKESKENEQGQNAILQDKLMEKVEKANVDPAVKAASANTKEVEKTTIEKKDIEPEVKAITSDEKQIKSETKVNPKINDEVENKKEESAPTKKKGIESIQDRLMEKVEKANVDPAVKATGANTKEVEKTTVEKKDIEPKVKVEIIQDKLLEKVEGVKDVKPEKTAVDEKTITLEIKVIGSDEKQIKTETKGNVKVNDELKEEKKEESTPVKVTIEKKEPTKVIDVKPEEKQIKTNGKVDTKPNEIKGKVDTKPNEKVKDTNKEDVTQVKEVKEEKEPDFEAIVRARIPKGDSPAEKELIVAEKSYKANYDYLF